MRTKQVCFETNIGGSDIRLIQTGINLFSVHYHLMKTNGLDYAAACGELGGAIMHAAACAGVLDNRNEDEAAEDGDKTPFFDTPKPLTPEAGEARPLEYPQVEQPTLAFCIHGYWQDRCTLRGCKAEQPSLIDMLAAHAPTA